MYFNEQKPRPRRLSPWQRVNSAPWRRRNLNRGCFSAFLRDLDTATRLQMMGRPRYFTPSEVAAHNTAEDLWVSFLGKVYDLSPLMSQYKGEPQQVDYCVTSWRQGRLKSTKCLCEKSESVRVTPVFDSLVTQQENEFPEVSVPAANPHSEQPGVALCVWDLCVRHEDSQSTKTQNDNKGKKEIKNNPWKRGSQFSHSVHWFNP